MFPDAAVAVCMAQSKSVVTSNLHETTFCCFEKISFKVYQRMEKGKLDILLFPVVLAPSKLGV